MVEVVRRKPFEDPGQTGAANNGSRKDTRGGSIHGDAFRHGNRPQQQIVPGSRLSSEQFRIREGGGENGRGAPLFFLRLLAHFGIDPSGAGDFFPARRRRRASPSGVGSQARCTMQRSWSLVLK